MSPEAVHKILEPYLFAIAACVALLAATALLLWRDGRARREAEAEAEAESTASRPVVRPSQGNAAERS